jgi:autotransporter-associated beta strand protein
MKHKILAVFILVISSMAVLAQPSFQQVGNLLIMSNANVQVEYNLGTGTAAFLWQGSQIISAFYSGVDLGSDYVEGVNFSNRTWSVVSSNQVAVTGYAAGLPAMTQYFTLDQANSFLTSVEMTSTTNLISNWMGPVVVSTTGGVNLGVTNDDLALLVPFDNDDFYTYDAESINSTGTGHEVAAFYDNTSRNGLVVGSVTHNVWKSGVYWSGSSNRLNSLNVYGGLASPWDVLPHGSVVGNTISSPTVFVGFGPDWRVTMQNFTAENTNFAPSLVWTNGVPFGWNSWGVTNYQNNISYAAAIAVSDSIHTNLEPKGFTNNGTVYVNLDSYGTYNLTTAQLTNFANNCHSNGQKAGTYWTPFSYWNTVSAASNSMVPGSGYYYSQILLRDSNGNIISNDTALALDPTHPGTKLLIINQISTFIAQGYDYVKLDFLSAGSLEGVHYDTNVTTGIEAYNEGMQFLLNQVDGKMFISESIAPLFPYQYGNSRRIACDAYESLIANTAYTMNSVTYGWWLDDLYQYNDPDIMVFYGYGATTNENQSRLINGAVTGVFLDGDILTNSASITVAQACLTNAAIDNVARAGQTFTPVEGNTGTTAANDFVRQDGTTWYIAVFNYTASATNETVNLSRAGLPSGNYIATNLWNETTNAIVTNSLIVSLNAKQAKLFQLNAITLKWSPNANSGVWDTGISSNWINLANSQQTVFTTNDWVLFDDTVGVPTNAVVTNTVSPDVITVNSSTNNFLFSGSGNISGQGSLVKEGSSILTLNSGFSLTGPVTISGGTIQAGNDAFNSVASVIITNGATLDFDGSSLADNVPITVSGAGAGGEGAIYNSGSVQYDQVLDITLAGNTTFGSASGGGSRWDLGDASELAGPYKVTINFPGGGYGEWDTVAIAPNVGDLELAQGSWGLKGLGAGMGDPTNTLTVDSGCQLDFWNSSYGPNSGYNKNLHVLTNASVQVLTSPNTFLNVNVTLEGGAGWYCDDGSGSQTMNGTYTLNGVVQLLIGDSTVTFTNVISGPGGFVWDNWNNQLVFSAANTYSGPTVIGNGLNLVLTGNGSISDSSLIFLGGSNPTNDSLDVSGRPDQTLTLASGQTLAGVGGIGGSLVVSAGAILSPAGTNTLLGITSGTNSTGTIAVSNAVTLNGTTVIKLNGSGVNDEVQAGAGITYGGTLNLVNISGAPLAVGNSFQIFSATNYSGSFANITPTTPGAGLAWDTSQLSSGILNVVTAPPSQPVINSTMVSGGNLIFSGTNGVANGTYYVLTSTNLATPLPGWTALATNTFDAYGNFNLTNSINPNAPQQFYLLQIP